MEFSLIHAGLAAGVGLAALPVILHMFMRQTPKHLVFPALRLIRERQKRSKKRLKVKNWLLLLARMDTQRPLERRRVDLLAVASDAVHDARAVAPSRLISLEVLDGPGTPEVIGDDARLRQVLGNLVANALQHTPETAPIVLRVGTVGDDAVLEVEDAGPGMAPADAYRVFERFYRADTSRTRASGGTGLGLSIVEALVRAHDGRVSIRTAPGAGCCFRVAIPRVTEAEFSPVPPAQP